MYPWWRRIDYEPHAWACVDSNCHSGDISVDVGANVGILTYCMSRAVGPKGLVYALEPDPFNYSLLVENLELNRCENVIPLQIAAAERTGLTEFFLAPREHHQMSAMMSNAPDAKAATVMRTTLDELLVTCDKLSYVKIDVEGAEMLVLRGSEALLRRFHPFLQVEVHGMFMKNKDSIDELFEFLENIGYRAINLIDNGPVTLQEFKRDTKLHVINPYTGVDQAYCGHGQLLFVNGSRDYRLAPVDGE